jgi:hypothetical protein
MDEERKEIEAVLLAVENWIAAIFRNPNGEGNLSFYREAVINAIMKEPAK